MVPWQRCQFQTSQNAMAHGPKISMRGEVADDIRRISNADDRAEADRRPAVNSGGILPRRLRLDLNGGSLSSTLSGLCSNNR